MRQVLLGLVMVGGLFSGQSAWAIGESPAERAAIRQMDILDRPNRIGHFYGNAVRRRNSYNRPTYRPGAPTRVGSQDGRVIR